MFATGGPYAIARMCRHWYCLSCARKRKESGETDCVLCPGVPVVTWTVERMQPVPVVAASVPAVPADEESDADSAAGGAGRSSR